MKKGQLSIETIIIVILALLVLVVVAIAFTGGMKNLWDQITGAGAQDLVAAVSKCEKLCTDATTAKNPNLFCTTVAVKDIGMKTCKELYPACSLSCA
jgi:hypothetical protein